MLAALLAGMLPFLLLGLVASCLRRALPLAGGGAALSLTLSLGHEVAPAIFVGFCAFIVLMVLFDELAAWAPTRTFILALEFTTAAAFAMVGAYAVFGSGGAEGIGLALAVGASGLAALAILLRFRTV